MKIIDISKHNGVIDFSKLKSQIDGVIIRLGYGDDLVTQDDMRFKSYVSECIKYGIPFGFYIYSYAKTIDQAKSEAEHCLRLAKPYKDKLSFPIYLDLEEAGTEKGAVQRAIVFGEIIERNGYWCGVYANEYWWKKYLGDSLDRFTKWVASYGRNNGIPNDKPKIKGLDIWQYTSVGMVSGINGNVDLNMCYRDFPKEIRGIKAVKNSGNVSGTKYKVGQKVKVSSYYAASTDGIDKAIIKNATGTITKIKAGARNPYLLNNGDIGWCNDGDIREVW